MITDCIDSMGWLAAHNEPRSSHVHHNLNYTNVFLGSVYSRTQAARPTAAGPGAGVRGAASAALGASAPRPGASAAQVLAYDNGHTTVMTVAAAVLFGSTIPLIICAATLYRKLRRLGVGAPGPPMG